MDPVIHGYANGVQASLAGVPREAQLLATRVRESDVQVTNLLSELETGSGRLECSSLVDLSARLNEAYKSKLERVADLLRLLDRRLAALESSRNEAMDGLRASEGTAMPQGSKSDVSLATATAVDSPTASTANSAGRERRRRKPARHEVVRNRGTRHAQKDMPTGTPTDTPTDTPKDTPKDASSETAVCICQQPPTGEMVQCDNEECSVGRYHLSCARLKSRPSGIWFCNMCIQIVQ